MKVVMNITGIYNKVVVSVPNRRWGHTISEEEARSMAIEIICMIKETDINIIKIIQKEGN